ncbi:MAG: F0F1 ATP synthase subunit gamma [Candidatus Peregrinibacteria bacterium GW2011_GWA2_33_10]|nr:MAG: F0F1 ATP synthase subunit gamma [Candidatus Peregrinibacteria bacterium GW2011_GWA2_33_10]KKP39949.1 MAG: F-type H+-transporting ATPase subunit gamma [Candidatus Peregrinibacteria bacterium GW2011_GWC2_33_13]OGJ50695.1 MAG: ATP synthase F1 subunit gamma [Candidatus Peregrinibacteria bacterium RIFOXYA2_FULL_33_7]
MSGALLGLRKKIGSIKNTKKITKAMQLVAASKMRNFQIKAVSTRNFVDELLNLLEKNIAHENSFTEKRKEGKTLFVIYTSDKGLCGGLNNHILRALTNSEKWKNTKDNEKLLFTIGKKSKDFARSNKIPVDKSLTGLPEKMTSLDALEVINEIMTYWTEKNVKEIIFLSPHYKNSFTYYPTFKTILPFSLDMIESHFKHKEDKKSGKIDQFMIYEPSEKRVIEVLYEMIIESTFLQSFLELKASEYSSRMIAMQSATDSADKIIHQLTLNFNKMRQAVITQELSELIGASEAISEEE